MDTVIGGTVKKLFALGWVVLAATACITVPKAAAPRVRSGKGELSENSRVVVFPPVCKGADDGCTDEFVSSLQGRVLSELELSGYSVLRGDELLATARSRTSVAGGVSASALGASGSVDRGGRSLGAGAGVFSVAGHGAVEHGGAGYDDVTPLERQQLLKDADVDGTLRLTVMIGDDTEAETPWYDVHLFEVTARLAVGDDVAVWTSHCELAAESTASIGGIGRSYAQAGDELGACVVREALR